MEELEKGPGIGWRLGELLVASEEEEEEIDSNNSGVYVRREASGRVSSVGSLGHSLAQIKPFRRRQQQFGSFSWFHGRGERVWAEGIIFVGVHTKTILTRTRTLVRSAIA